MRTQNFVSGLIVAVFLAAALVKPVIFGIDTWKIVLGIAGLLLFAGAGLSKN